MEQLQHFEGLLPEGQGRNLALAVLHVPHSLDSGPLPLSICDHQSGDQMILNMAVDAARVKGKAGLALEPFAPLGERLVVRALRAQGF